MNKVIVGKIINTHGIKGELKVQKSNEESFNRENPFYIDDFDKSFYVEYSRNNPGISYIKLKGYDNINDVLKFKNKFIRIDEDDLYELDNDEYFIKDLLNLNVFDINGNLVGEILDVDTYAANDVYIISTKEGVKSVPAVKEFIKEINLKEKKVVINFIEGM